MKKLAIPAFLVLLLAGCALSEGGPQSESAPESTAISASVVVDIDDGIVWARGLDDSVSTLEMTERIDTIGALLLDLDLWFQDSNEIGQGLFALGLDIRDDPDDAGSKVEDLNDIVDEIQDSISKGDVP
ncbi:MAG: hypothetical protein V7618_11575 [Rhodoglobus sp.]